MKTVCIVTGNTKKYTEMSEALSHVGIHTKRIEHDIEEIQSLDHAEVIADKVKKAFAFAQRPVLVDDAGIYFTAYHDFPGVYSKHAFKALGYEGIYTLVAPGDGAVFKCFVAYMDADLKEPMIFSGEYRGVIAQRPNNTRVQFPEMPYAPMFKPHDAGPKACMEDMTPQERQNDHRHQALNAFVEWYRVNRP